MIHRYAKSFTASAEHIDELGHVNNSVWVQWIQELATAHWDAVADPVHRELYFWVVTRHEIDYRGNIAEGEIALGETWIPDAPRGAQSVRHVEFSDANGKRLVAAQTTWAMLDRATQRLVRVRPEVLTPFQSA